VADHHLELDFDSNEVTLGQLVSASSVFAQLIREVAKQYAGTDREPVRWLVEVRPGSVKLPVRGVPTLERLSEDEVEEIATAVLDGLVTLDDRPERPKFFSDRALVEAKTLANMTTEQLPITVRNGNKAAPATKRLMTHVDEVLGPPRDSIGTVEGKLQALNTHERPRRFTIYDLLTDRRVDCFFSSRIELDEVLAAVERRVAVTGIIKTRPSGERLSIEAHELRVFPAEEELPTPDEVLGIIPRSESA
jgi:hypothetical protein